MHLTEILKRSQDLIHSGEGSWSYNLETIFLTERTTNTGSTIEGLTATHELLKDKLVAAGFPKKFVMLRLTGDRDANVAAIANEGLTTSVIEAEANKKKNVHLFAAGTIFVNLTIEQFSLLGLLDLHRRGITWSKLNGGHRTLRHFLDVCATAMPESVIERTSKAVNYTVFPDLSDTGRYHPMTTRQIHFNADVLNKSHSFSSRLLSYQEMSAMLSAVGELASLERLYEQEVHTARNLWLEHVSDVSKAVKTPKPDAIATAEPQTFTNLTWS